MIQLTKLRNYLNPRNLIVGAITTGILLSACNSEATPTTIKETPPTPSVAEFLGGELPVKRIELPKGIVVELQQAENISQDDTPFTVMVSHDDYEIRFRHDVFGFDSRYSVPPDPNGRWVTTGRECSLFKHFPRSPEKTFGYIDRNCDGTVDGIYENETPKEVQGVQLNSGYRSLLQEELGMSDPKISSLYK